MSTFEFEILKSTGVFCAEGRSEYSCQIIKTIPYNTLFLRILKKTANLYPRTKEEPKEWNNYVLIPIKALPLLIDELPKLYEELLNLQAEEIPDGPVGRSLDNAASGGMVSFH